MTITNFCPPLKNYFDKHNETETNPVIRHLQSQFFANITSAPIDKTNVQASSLYPFFIGNPSGGTGGIVYTGQYHSETKKFEYAVTSEGVMRTGRYGACFIIENLASDLIKTKGFIIPPEKLDQPLLYRESTFLQIGEGFFKHYRQLVESNVRCGPTGCEGRLKDRYEITYVSGLGDGKFSENLCLNSNEPCKPMISPDGQPHKIDEFLAVGSELPHTWGHYALIGTAIAGTLVLTSLAVKKIWDHFRQVNEKNKII